MATSILRSLSLGVSAMAVCTAMPAVAQEAAPEDTLGEIVVTAQKRADNLQDVPIAITAISGEDLAKYEQATIESIAQETPGLSFSRAGGQNFIYLRGIGSDIQGSASDPSVALNIDGAYVGRFELGSTQFFDLERVEVLRGPQGTLYGRNATGGVINMISRGPGDEFDARLRLSYSSWDRKEIEAAVGGPLDDDGIFGARLAVRWSKDNGFTDDLDPAGTNDIDDQDVLGVRGTVTFAPGPNVDIKVVVDHTRMESGNTSIRPLDNLGLAETLGAAPTEFGETRNDLPTFDEWDTTGVVAQLDVDLGGNLSLTSITANRTFDQEFLFNTDGTEVDITRTQFIRDYKSFTQELRLNYNSEALRAVVGAFYLEEDNNGVLGLPRIGGVPSPRSFILPAMTETESYALFADATLAITPQFSIIAGIRYSEDKKDDLTGFAIIPNADGLFGGGSYNPVATRDVEQKWDAWTPRFGIEFEPNEDILVYATASRGFKSGGLNSYDLNAPFDPEFVWSYEAGVKSELMGGRMRLNGSVFHYDYSDLQVSTFINGFTVVTNAASAKINGFELESTVRAAPGLTLVGSVGYLDAEYEDFLSPFGRTPTGDTNVVDVSGNQLRNAPEWKLVGGADYEGDLGTNMVVFASARATHTSRTFFSQFNEDVASNGALTLVDARLGVGSDDGRWQVAVFGKNLTGEDYFANVVRFTSTSDPAKDTLGIGNALGYPAQGRQIGIQAIFDF
ncbi:TonB-dependent receptor [Altererythrobacter sp. MF3-039]|uniref:TonB-dependent receptor n=1 Tax=Altererythrobacter sp. MF3-039 TaxID=3252901 RepID=UPI00390CD900